MKSWKRLERQVGRTVTEEEVFNLIFEDFDQRRNERVSKLLASQIMKGG